MHSPALLLMTLILAVLSAHRVGAQNAPSIQERRVPEPKVRGLIRPVDLATFPTTFHSEFVAGPNSGLDSAYLVLSRVPAGGSGPALHTHPVDQFYFVLKGEMQLQLGSDTFTAGPDTLVMIPAGTPHRNWNTSAAEEIHVELIVPPVPLDKLLSPAEPRKIENAAALIRHAKRDAFDDSQGPIKGFATQWLARRDSGSKHLAINVAQVQPKAGGPGLHIHAFDQIYFVIEGTMNVQLGLKQYQAKPNTYVIIPAGTVHRQWNEGPGIEKHLTLLIPEPNKGEPFDIEVELKGEVAAPPR
jgi:mannose-6-phosphate isomerase-like protein (cupin superfamily)